MMNTSAKKALLKEERNALRVLAGVYGFDFEKPHTIARYDGAWTTKKLLTAAGLSGDEKIILLYHDGNAYGEFFTNRLNMVEIDGNVCDNSRRACESGLYNTIIDEPWAKHKYNDARKNPRSWCYIIAQECEHLRNVVRRRWDEKPRDARQRFELVKTSTTRNIYDDITWIDSVVLKDTTTNGAEVHYKMNRRTMAAPLDKSGYITDYYQQQLISRLNNYKHKKRVAAVEAYDFKNEIKELRAQLLELKHAAVEELHAANDYGSMWDAGATARKVALLFNRVDTYEKRAHEKTFRSMEHARDAFDDIKKDMEELKK